MGRKSLEATKLLCSWIVLALVAFFRGACDFLALDFVFEVDDPDEAFFFLVFDDWLLGDGLDDEELCAENPLPGSSNSTARLDAVRRLRNIGDSV